MNENVYSHPFLPQVLRVSEEQIWRNVRNVGISVCPFKYYPDKNILSILSKFILHVNFDKPADEKSESVVYYETCDDFNLFDNIVYLLPNRVQSSNYNNNYLIIVGNSTIYNSNDLKKFKLWKALRGFNTMVVPLSYILSSPSYSQDEVKNFIRDEVGSGGHVLFIGDDSSIPMAYVYSFYNSSQHIKGDYWYGYGTGNSNWMADIAVGRFSTNSAWEFKKMVDKTIRYESTCPLSDSTLLVAHKEAPTYYWGFQNWCEMISNANNIEPMSFVKAYGASIENTGTNATNAYVISKINQGVPIVCYLGYGYPNYWGGLYGENGSGDPSYAWNSSGELFYSTEVENMNSNSCAVFFSNSTNTGDISVNGNMLEAFTRATNGAAAFVGSTTEVYGNSDFNETFSFILFDLLLNDGVYNLGDLTNIAHISNVNGYVGAALAKDNALSYICGGDPALELWTGTPQSFGDVNLTESNGNITITTQYGGIYDINVVDENGNLLFSYTATNNTKNFPKPSGNFYLGLNKHNYIPHIIYYNEDAEYIQKVTFNYDAYYHHTPLEIGDGVTADVEDGPVIVEDGYKLIIQNGTGGISIIAGFKCEKGGTFEVK